MHERDGSTPHPARRENGIARGAKKAKKEREKERGAAGQHEFRIIDSVKANKKLVFAP